MAPAGRAGAPVDPKARSALRRHRPGLLRFSELDRTTVEHLLDRAEALRRGPEAWPAYPRLVVGMFFLAPSTRTLLGFHSAVVRLGGAAITLAETRYTPGMTHSESLEDTARVVSAYCDVLITRLPEADMLDLVDTHSAVPVVNAGNGDEEHPSQALIDLFAMRRCLGNLERLRVGIVGDLRGSRSAHSLVLALSLFAPAEIRLMHPEGRGLLGKYLGRAAQFPMSTCKDGLALDDLDVVYMTGLPEGQGKEALPEAVRASFRLTPDTIARLPQRAIVLSPLPRIDEIDPTLDTRPNARYFEQSADALYVRMAVLEYVLERRA